MISTIGVVATKSTAHMTGVHLTGMYIGTDTEDGSDQRVVIECSSGYCDITLFDFAFSTCSLLTGSPYFGGVAAARNISEDMLDSFTLNLFCVQPGKLIDIENDEPSTSLTGDMTFPEDGVIYRSGPGFNYFNVLKSSDESTKSSNSSEIADGLYYGIDTEDGSLQQIKIICTEAACDIMMSDFSFSTCFELLGEYGGVATANDVPKDSLDEFMLNLYCRKEGAPIDIENDVPTVTLTGNMLSLQNGIIQRTGPGFRYFKSSTNTEASHSRSETHSEPDSVSKGLITEGYYAAINHESGTTQYVDILCEDMICDIVLTAVYSCREITQDRIVLGGVAVAKGIHKNSFDDFTFDLFCIKMGDYEIDVDTSEPSATIPGNLVPIQDGVFEHTDPGVMYFRESTNVDDYYGGSKDGSIANGMYFGNDIEDGSTQHIDILCTGGYCDITLLDYGFSTCARINGYSIFGGVAVARNISEDSLDDYTLNLFCDAIPSEIDIDNDEPTTTLTGDIIVLKDGIIHRSGPGLTYYKGSDF